MLRDSLSLPANSDLRTDVCVVGAGPAGIALARRLAELGVRVVLLESGGLRFDAETQTLCEGENLGEPYWSLETSRLRGLGGTSQHWTGWCRPLDRLDLKARSSGSWPELWGGNHHLGTTRMHDDPRRGVVDRNCRVHSLDNLFVAGSSVFPTGGYANPTLTLLALALRLGEHLAREPA